MRGTRGVTGRALAVVTLVAIGGFAAGCANGSPDPAETTPVATPTGVALTVDRRGGFAGVNQSVEVSATGAWIYRDYRSNDVQTGTLTTRQAQSLADLVSDPQFVTELVQTSGATCNDGFQYTFHLGSRSASFDDCGDSQTRPLVSLVIMLLNDATSF